MTSPVLALDIGGTKLAAGLVAPDGSVLRSERVPTPREDVWTALRQLARRVLAEESVAGVGVGCGGPMTWPDGVVSPLNMPSWRGFPLRERLATEYPDLPVRLHNDAICFAVGEHWAGAGRGLSNVLGMVVSTGVGGGLVLGGQVVDGRTGNAGHIGHVVVDPYGPDCTCGGRGCLESIARGPAIAAWAGASDAASLAATGDEVARAAFARAGHAVGIAVASAVHLLDLDAVVIGGGVAGAGELFFGPLRDSYRLHARLPYAREVRVLPAALPEPGLVGAAALVHAGNRYWTAS